MGVKKNYSDGKSGQLFYKNVKIGLYIEITAEKLSADSRSLTAGNYFDQTISKSCSKHGPQSQGKDNYCLTISFSFNWIPFKVKISFLNTVCYWKTYCSHEPYLRFTFYKKASFRALLLFFVWKETVLFRQKKNRGWWFNLSWINKHKKYSFVGSVGGVFNKSFARVWISSPTKSHLPFLWNAKKQVYFCSNKAALVLLFLFLCLTEQLLSKSFQWYSCLNSSWFQTKVESLRGELLSNRPSSSKSVIAWG